MEAIHVHGGVSLQGKVRIQGSKNAALPILAATILTRGENVIRNCPRIADVYQMLQLLTCLGCKVCREGDGIKVDAGNVVFRKLPAEAITGMRSSMFLMGALLGRNGEVTMEYPGGCVIGARPVDLHLNALRQMGAVFKEEEDRIVGKAPDGLHGADIFWEIPSVGATENIVLAAVTAEGVTRIHGAAREPEVEHLCRYLAACGADIEGIGTRKLCIHGSHMRGCGKEASRNTALYENSRENSLHGTVYTIPSDRIVAGTYLLACLGTGGSVFLEKAPCDHLEAVIRLARQMGAECQDTGDGLYVQAPEHLSAVDHLITLPYPDFPTDLQSVALTVMTRAEGKCLVEETIFENRFRVVEPLQQMGAEVKLLDSSKAVVKGPVRLHGAETEAMELRGGAALVVAGLMAEGESVIRGCRYIDRGYENICKDFRELGARIYSV